MDELSPAKCRECHKPIMVARYSPHPLEREATGMAATMWDYEREQDRFVGWICTECAFELVGEGKPGGISGGPDLTFHY